MSNPLWLEIINAINSTFQIIALASAFLYFFPKLNFGYYSPNLSISLDCSRLRKCGEDKKDYLICKLSLKKGNVLGIELHDVKFRKTKIDLSTGVDFKPILEQQFKRIPSEPSKRRSNARYSIENFDNPASTIISTRAASDISTRVTDDYKFLVLPPGEEAEFCFFDELCSDKPYLIEVVVIGKPPAFLGKTWKQISQWRATTVSLPIPVDNDLSA